VIIDVLLIILLLCAILGYLFAFAPEFFYQSQGGDYPYYVQIAHAPVGNAVPSPWRYRVLNPWMASLLMGIGVGTDAAFLALTVLFAGLSCLLMRIYLSQLGVSMFAARTGTLLFAVSVGAFIPLRRYYGYTDALTNALTLFILVQAQAGRYASTAALLGIGTVAKESMLLLLPYLTARLIAAGAGWRHTAAIVFVPLAVFATLRLLLPPDAGGAAPVALTWAAQVEYWRTAMVHGPGRWILWAFAYSMGPVWLLAVAGARDGAAFLRQSWLLLLPLLAPLLRTTDTERALMLAFPVVFPLAAFALERWHGSRRAAAVAVLAVACTWLAQVTFDWRAPQRLGIVTTKDAVFLVLCMAPLLPWLWSAAVDERRGVRSA
jgi:hypothetical protein